jgi:hypothetical protein
LMSDDQERTESTVVTVERSHATIGPKRYRCRRKNGSQYGEG